MSPVATDHLSVIFGALADPTRRAILARLADGEATVNQLAEPFALTLPAISKHLKVLERAGLISRARQAQWRPCRLESDALRAAAAWVDRYGSSGSRASTRSSPTCQELVREHSDDR